MQRAKMIRMLKAGVDPLEVSQEKWREIRRSVERSDYKRADRQNDNCALCHINHGCCDKCVLKSCNCDPPTVYFRAAEALSLKLDRWGAATITKQEVLEAIDNMIDALEDLKK